MILGLDTLVDQVVWPHTVILPVAKTIYHCVNCDLNERERLGMTGDSLNLQLVDIVNKNS
jgi:hypothetical protein